LSTRVRKRAFSAFIAMLLMTATATIPAAATVASSEDAVDSAASHQPPAPRQAHEPTRSIQTCALRFDAPTCSGVVEALGRTVSLLGPPQSCVTDATSAPSGEFDVVGGSSHFAGSGRLIRFRVEVERGLAFDGACFARAVEWVLRDARSWVGGGRYTFERVSDDSHGLRIILASPDTVDALCRPLRTGGKFSCKTVNRVVLNAWRWVDGAASFSGDIVNYRRYLVNHEVGHFLGKRHASCLDRGGPAPVMMQQTKSAGDCLPNGWPYPDS
jgi:hypothetical protein